MSNFYDRKDELDALVKAFDSLNGPKIFCLQGVSGTGKTRLVLEFYNTIANQSKYWKKISADIGEKILRSFLVTKKMNLI